MRDSLVVIFGGTGFIGRQLVKRLAATGASIRVVTRREKRVLALKPCGDVGQIVARRLLKFDDASIKAALEGATHVVNLTGILFERYEGEFEKTHTKLAERIAEQAAAASLKQMVHVSALGCDLKHKSLYAQSKAKGELAVRSGFPDAVILRPSIVFGPQDGFFCRFGEMASVSPFLPLIDGGKTRFQPVYVGDVVSAIMDGLHGKAASGSIYELGGPKAATFEELLRYIVDQLGYKRYLLPVSSSFLQFPARLMEYLPNPQITRDQLLLLEKDNVVTGKTKTLADLGIQPMPFESVVPQYLRAFAKPKVQLALGKKGG